MTVQTLLDFIGKYESRNNPDAVWGGIAKRHHPPMPVTRMEVGGVLDWQDSIDPLYMSEAAGEWQFMEDTLRGLYRSAGVTLSDTFDRTTQIKLATQLLRRRGLDDYRAGRMTDVKFAQSLSKEWASMPCTIKDRNGRPAKGQSYYAGDGLNAAHASIDDFMAAVRSVRHTPAERPTSARKTPSATQSTENPFAALLRLLSKIIGGTK